MVLGDVIRQQWQLGASLASRRNICQLLAVIAIHLPLKSAGRPVYLPAKLQLVELTLNVARAGVVGKTFGVPGRGHCLGFAS